jgi:hypothetical protein
MAADPARRRDAANIVAQGVLREQRRLRSLSRFAETVRSSADAATSLEDGLAETGKAMLRTFMLPADVDRLARAGFRVTTGDARVPVRNAAVKGPLAPGGEWLTERAGAPRIAIARLPNADDLTYEIANFIDGRRSVADIRDAVSAEYDPIDLAAVAEYIDLLAKAGAVRFTP